MSKRGDGSRGWTRREAVPVILGAAPALLGGEIQRYADPATDLDVYRLTEPSVSSMLPPTSNLLLPRHGDYLVYVSDRSGSQQAYALDLKKYENRQLTEASALQVNTVTLTPDARNVCYVDGERLMLSPTSGGAKTHEIYQMAPGTVPGLGMSVTPDGPSALVSEGGKRLLMVHLSRRSVTVLAESNEAILEPMPRPKRASVLYRTESGALWVAHFDKSRNFQLKTAPGGTGPARWAPDGRTIFYLNYPEEKGKPHTLRELNPDTGEDKLVSPTSQFAAFGANKDASVFVGASESKAGPYILLLVRKVERELTLCLHKSSDPASVSPMFSTDSQRIFFESDREGKPVLYSMVVDKLVEKTQDDDN